MAKEMLINVSEGEECRIALVEDGRLEELYMERTSSTSHVGNIYKGKVTNVEASIQAAFVDFGLGRNGFLHISDLMPTYFGRKGEEIQESVGRKMARRDRPPIQRCLRRGDELIVQIIKEGIGTKGPTLSSYLSIPGRILVMMPGMANKGVSKKIEDDEERRRLRLILDGLKPPKEVGFIIRTAGIGKTKAEIQRDFTYLTRLWQQIEKKRDSGAGPMELYTEGDLVSRTVRDVYTTDIDRIVVDNKDVAKRVKEVIKLANPRTKNKVELLEEPIPLFHKYNIEKDIEQMYSRHVPLPSGGSLVIDSTEAIVAIDVNSGKFRDHSDAETTAFKTDMEAAEEIPRQLRLRDLGGVIICDFIDLRYERHRRELEQKLHDKFKNDRAKTKVLRMSDFGIIEMTRQRMRPSLKRSIYFDCPHCKGAGLVKTPESMSLDVMRRLTMGAHDQRVVRVELTVSPEVAFHLQNRKRAHVARLEEETGKQILVRGEQSMALDEVKLELFDIRDGKIYLPELGMAPELPQTGQRRHQQGGPGGRSDRQERGRRPQPQQGRRREAAPLEEGYNLDRGEEAVDEREETREEEETTRKPAAPIAPPERPSSYSNYTDNDVDLGDDEDPSQPEPRHDQRPDRREERIVSSRDGDRDANRDGNRGGSQNAGRGGGREQRPQSRPAQGQRPDVRRDNRDGDRDHRDNRGGAQAAPRGGRPDNRGNQRDDQRSDQRNAPREPRREPQGQPAQQPAGGPGGDEGNLPPGVAGEGGPRRRRRRRGGRGRGRNRDRQDQMGPNGEILPPRDAGDTAFEGQAESGEQRDDEPRDENESDQRDTGRDAGAAMNERGVEAPEVQPESRQAPEAATPEESPESAAVEDGEEAAIEAEPVKKPRRRRGTRGRAKKTAAATEDVIVKPHAKAPAVPKASLVREPEPAAPIVRTGSSDRHHLIVDEAIADEEPIVPSPVRRPRTYRDLDEIPDDLE